MERLISLFGIVVFLAIAWVLCPRKLRRAIEWRTTALGMLILFVFAFLVLRTPVNGLFRIANSGVERLLAFSSEGARFVFGNLVADTKSFGFIFAFQVLPTIIFFAALMAVLYYLRVMPFIISKMGRFLSKTLRVSGAESFSVVADIFVGHTEAPLVIRPYLPTVTNSELMTCMTCGMATTAVGVLAAYVWMLRDFVPGVAGHLIACSVMCAPASIVIAKLMLPEIGKPETGGNAKIEISTGDANLVDAVARGTSDGLHLALNVAAMLISFLALVAMVNFGLHKLGTSLEAILGIVFAPIAWLMGVPWVDVTNVGGLLGQKMVLNEFVAYSKMGEALRADPTFLTERGRLIAAYALCGFANFSSIGIQIGGYSALAPNRRSDLSRLAFRAMIAGTLATCMSAAVAGLLL
ncbi:MAG: nucleoside transporter C-terminal domain-containing protein [Pseudomonadota bacterium]